MTLVDLSMNSCIVLYPIPFVMECTVAPVFLPVQRNLRTESNTSLSCTDVEVVELLIQRGCNVTIGDKDIWTSFLSQLLPGKCCVTTPSKDCSENSTKRSDKMQWQGGVQTFGCCNLDWSSRGLVYVTRWYQGAIWQTKSVDCVWLYQQSVGDSARDSDRWSRCW